MVNLDPVKHTCANNIFAPYERYRQIEVTSIFEILIEAGILIMLLNNELSDSS